MVCDAAIVFRFVFLLQLGIYVRSLFTDPPVATNGGSVDLPAVENATNVSVFCEVTFLNNSANSIWRLGSTTIAFGQLAFSNFVLVENIPRRTNLTLLWFSRASLDMMVLECTNGIGSDLAQAFFIPRFIG